MKYLIVVFSFIALSSCGVLSKNKKQEPIKTPAVVLTNKIDSISYAVGVNVGEAFKQQMKQFPGGEYNPKVLTQAFSAALQGDTTLFNYDKATQLLEAYLTDLEEVESSKLKIEGQKFLAENKLKEGVKQTESGLQYKVIKQGTGAKPAFNDKVKVHYEGFLVDGKKFDSSVERGEPITFGLDQVIQGWSEGVQLMSVGSKYMLYIPYQLGYGERGAGQVIPPYATLIFEVELLGIE